MNRPLLIFTCAAALAARGTFALPVVLHLKGDQRLEGEAIRATPTGIEWKLAGDVTSVAEIAYSSIIRVEFPPVPEWTAADRALTEGHLTDAVTKFKAIAAQREQYFHPAPGNYASLAQRRLLDCYRELGDATALAETAAALDPQTLPPAERKLPATIAAWSKLGRQDWAGALQAAQALPAATGRPEAIELAYIRGTALAELHRDDEALRELLPVYVLNLDFSPAMAERALLTSAKLLAAKNDLRRHDELKAQLRIYAAQFGAGNLWPDADPALIALMNEPDPKPPPKPTAPTATTVTAPSPPPAPKPKVFAVTDLDALRAQDGKLVTVRGKPLTYRSGQNAHLLLFGKGRSAPARLQFPIQNPAFSENLIRGWVDKPLIATGRVRVQDKAITITITKPADVKIE